MNEESQDIVSKQVESLGYRALSTAHSFSAALRLAPSLAIKKILVGIVWEELDRFQASSDLYATLRPGVNLHDKINDRLAELPAPESWLEMIVIQAVFNLAGKYQLGEASLSSHAAYAKLAKTILEKERMHNVLGDESAAALRNLCKEDPDRIPVAQSYLELWLGHALRSFGRPGSSRGQRAIELGLKSRDSAEVIREYLAELMPVIEMCGLEFPKADRLGLELPTDSGLN